ncbi:hypothetical protein FACS1894155_10020 [Bacteroidia bacterium]|nr:hypothetical protein FACS189455_5080 [Bacteroidia bacterium]GHU90968.1 hypothetical protein FACS1894155_10020 [Bacteroidia bacterium]
MKNSGIKIIMLLCSIFVFAACEKSDINYESDFDKSYKEWIKFKIASNDCYRYEMTTVSWTGLRTWTTITVTNGNITQRSYKLQHEDFIEVWTESGNEIGSHETYQGLLTLDQIYDKARNEWLLKRKNAQTYFKSENDGMLSHCGYVDNNCADDCFSGINISYIEALNKK